ncbi:MAG TPA: hypothetical protein VFW11_22345 [Cyclobacteriaceae bacterium]|nr:hypothetical protein [Cyclobacteriaceae bacterium]
MGKNIREFAQDMNEMVLQGKLVEAAEKYYAPAIKTIEFDGSVTYGKESAMKKLIDFMATIKRVKRIDLLRSVSDGQASFSEFILDFEMKDGTNLYLHEIVRALWENGQAIEERYFKG